MWVAQAARNFSPPEGRRGLPHLAGPFSWPAGSRVFNLTPTSFYAVIAMGSMNPIPPSIPDPFHATNRYDALNAALVGPQLAALDWLMGRINYERTAFVPYHERQLKLDRMRQLLTRLGQPDAGMKIVHVAGTKGKGSTSAMIAGDAHRRRLPHGRLQLAAPGANRGAIRRRRPALHRRRTGRAGRSPASGRRRRWMKKPPPTATQPAGPPISKSPPRWRSLHFVERQVDAAVLEVGLGGRLDSTNVCLPAVSVITSISFDHMKQLGNTLAAIAREKAGIIKPGVPVVCGVTDAGAASSHRRNRPRSRLPTNSTRPRFHLRIPASRVVPDPGIISAQPRPRSAVRPPRPRLPKDTETRKQGGQERLMESPPLTLSPSPPLILHWGP